jgi:hypothetical protein
MIASLRGRVRARSEDRVILEAAGVGYEVFLPPVTQRALVDVAGANGLALTGMARITGRTPTGRALATAPYRVQPEFGEAQPKASRANMEIRARTPPPPTSVRS